MKNIYLLLLICICSIKLNAQTYNSAGLSLDGYVYDTIQTTHDTLSFVFSGLQSGGIGQAKLRITYAGDFGASSEYINAFLPDWTMVPGQTDPDPSGNDCTTLVDSLYFDASLINNFTATDTIYLVTSHEVNTFCTEQRVRVELIYDYCIFGVPTYANFTIPFESTCEMYASQTLVGSPAGGTYTGTGVTGNTFNPSGLAPGFYPITYTATDAIGCVTSKTKSIRIKRAPSPYSDTICENMPIAIDLPVKHVFSTNLTFTNTIDTAAVTNLPGINQSPTTWYYSQYIESAYYMIDTITSQNSMVVDHNAISGDDRGGILISDTNVFILGDNGFARYNLDLQNGTYLNLINDAVFNDLTTKKIYSFTDSSLIYPSNDNISNFIADRIIELDINLNPTGVEIPLSETVTIGESNTSSTTIILSGFSEMVFSDVNGVFYKLEIESGELTNMGTHSTIDPYGSENWSDWGVLGFDGVDYHAFYRNNSTSKIVDYNFGTSAETQLEIVNDWSDLASFTVNQETNRLYFHYEGSTATFGGLDETLGYTEISDSFAPLNGGILCPAEMTFTFNTVDLGPDTTVCDYNGAYVIEAGFGYQSYSWNGENNNWNVFPVTSTGQVSVDVVDEVNCHLTDTILVTFDTCLGMEDNTTMAVAVYPNPNNGQFTIDGGTSTLNTIQIMDVNGKIVYHLNNNQSTSIQVDQLLESGIYIVKIQSGEAYNLVKIVVQ